MIYHPIEKLTQAGIEEILIVTGVEHMGAVVGLLGSGKEFGCRITYRVQDEAGGIAQALGLASHFVHGDCCTVILGDNIFADNIQKHVEVFESQKDGARILIKEVPDPQRFGVAEIKESRIVSIEEKPKNPKSNYAVTGVYFYDADVFKIIQNLKPSHRGELEITDVNNHYISKKAHTYGVLKGWWSDAGTFDSLTRVNHLLES
jgi:glucose-1-phosphate thymidylyltransferase